MSHYLYFVYLGLLSQRHKVVNYPEDKRFHLTTIA
jgi:hypothetical protein